MVQSIELETQSYLLILDRVAKPYKISTVFQQAIAFWPPIA